MPDVNTELMNMLLRHQHFVRAYENQLLRDEILPILRQAKIDMTKKFRGFGKAIGRKNLSQLTKTEMAFLQQKIREVEVLISVASSKIQGRLDKNLPKFIKEVEKINVGFLKSALPIAVAFNRIPLERLKKLLDQPLGGEKYAARLKKNYKDAVGIMRREIAIGILGGESIPQVRRRLMGVGRGIGGKMGAIITHRAEMIARTEILRIANAVNADLYQRNDDVVKGVMWVATLDQRTCPQCAPLDGTTYFYEKNEKPPEIPQHPNCRCILSPITRSWKELGDNSKMAKQLDKLDAGARASMSGYVPAKVKYPQWFDAQPDKFKRDVLGPNRFSKYKQKGLSYNKMIKNGRWIPLKDLKNYK